MIQPETDTIYAEVQQDSVELVVETPVTSLFENHILVDQNSMSFIERSTSESGFGFLILAICAGIIIYLMRNSDALFNSVFKAGFDVNLANQDARTENSQRARNLMLLQLTAIISLALFSSTVYTRVFDSEIGAPLAFLWASVIVLNFLMIKRIVLWLLTKIFDLQTEFKIFRFSGNILLSLVGLALLPLSVFLLFSPQIPINVILFAGSGVAILFYLKQLIRGVQISLGSSQISTLYLFYYFCALELLPVFVFIRVAISL